MCSLIMKRQRAPCAGAVNLQYHVGILVLEVLRSIFEGLFLLSPALDLHHVTAEDWRPRGLRGLRLMRRLSSGAVAGGGRCHCHQTTNDPNARAEVPWRGRGAGLSPQRRAALLSDNL